MVLMTIMILEWVPMLSRRMILGYKLRLFQLRKRKVETKQILVEEVRKDEEIQKNMELEANIAGVDTDDEINEAEEYEAWKAREIDFKDQEGPGG
ncbi:hypothetical protein Ddye_011980 [Dipteronia dyeriana]|uniref:Micro-fibrillar-associated protein 1 C-terminal domain-containing protein n=1 Tax=Dipteronia dyeriana TaxID=168575 RepID=A0AAD9X3K9_9ROSI|nr:hypothetical protein Ddye_011980 [Dipteronia dyeriana]